MELGTRGTLANDPICSQWMEHDHSSLLLLTARNHADSGYQRGSWLSPGVLEYAQSCQGIDTKVVFYAPRSKDTPSIVLSAIIGEILGWDREFFRTQNSNIYEHLERVKSSSSSLKSRFEILADLLNAWAQYKPASSIYIILDRIDECLGPRELPKEERQEKLKTLKLFIQELLKLVKRRASSCKILLLAEDVRWPNWDYSQWPVTPCAEGPFFQRRPWQQGFRI